jgi:hypothetical protein
MHVLDATQVNKNHVKNIKMHLRFSKKSLKGIGAGILRSVGAQFYSSVFLFIAFYCISLPIGLSLMLYTKLRVLGN